MPPLLWPCTCWELHDSDLAEKSVLFRVFMPSHSLCSNGREAWTLDALLNVDSLHYITVMDMFACLNTRLRGLRYRGLIEVELIAGDAAALLTKIADETSLRYAIHLITAAHLVAQKRKSAKVDVEDVARAYTLFIDVKRSTEFMLEHQQQYLYNEVPEAEEDAEVMQQ